MKKKKKKTGPRPINLKSSPSPPYNGISSPADSPRLIEQRGIQLTIGQFHSSTILTLSTVKNTPRKNTIARRDPIEPTRSIEHTHIYIYLFIYLFLELRFDRREGRDVIFVITRERGSMV